MTFLLEVYDYTDTTLSDEYHGLFKFSIFPDTDNAIYSFITEAIRISNRRAHSYNLNPPLYNIVSWNTIFVNVSV